MTQRILIVDDADSMRNRVRESIESLPGYEVCGEAADGVEAVECAVRLWPDLIIMDLVMPRMNGLQAAAVLQAEAPNVPIILYTLHKNTVPDRLAREFGIRAVVSKLDKIEVLLAEVGRLGKARRSALA